MSDVVIEEQPKVVETLVEVTVQEVQFFEDHVRAILTGGVEKILSHDEFRAILNKTAGLTAAQKLEGFNLPSNVFFFAHSATEIQISCYYASRVSEIRYHNKKMKIVMPNLVISHVLNSLGKGEWQMSQSKYFSTEKSVSQLPRTFIDRVDHGAGIYLMPMSNTYDEGRMCYGGNQMVNRFVENNLRGLDWYYQYMFESPFNDDLGVRAVSGFGVKEWYLELEKIAKEGGTFPYKHLRGYRAA